MEAQSLIGESPDAMLKVPEVGSGHSVSLSTSQHEVWLDQNAWPDSAHLNIGGGAYIHGVFDLNIFKSALGRLVAENQALRLVPAMDGTQLLLDNYQPELEIIELQASNDPAQSMRDWWNKRIQVPFALGKRPPWRFTLLRARDNFHGLTIQFHHLVMDGWGTTLVMQRWSEIYNALFAQTAASPASDPGYLNFIEESSTYRASPAFQRDADYWTGRLPALPEPLFERRFPEMKVNGLADCELVVKRLERSQYDALSEFAIQSGASTFNLFLAVLAIYCSRAFQRPNIVVGVPSLNRGGRRHRETMGMFVGVMAIEVNVTPGQTTSGLLAAIAATMRGALRHPRFPLSELGKRLELIKSGRDGIFDVLLSFERQDYSLNFGDAKLQGSRQLFSGKARYPLGVTVCEFHDDEDVELILEGSQVCFSSGETALLAERLWALARAMMASPNTPVENLEILPASERHKLLDELHTGLATGEAPATFIKQFEEHVAQRPHAPALVWEQQSIDYARLDGRANSLARRLIQFGPVKNRIVALAIERSVDMVAAVLAIAKAGAAFLPLDPDTPVARLAEILAESNVAGFLIKEQDQERLGHLHPSTMIVDWDIRDTPNTLERVAGEPVPTDLAYVLFTSGSTGRAKGVMIDHGTLSRRLAWLSRAYGVTAQDRSAQATQITFDPSLIELCLPLIHGASVALPPPGRVLPESLAEFAAIHGVTIMAFVPSTLSRFLDGAINRDDMRLRVACCGGEVLPPELANRYLSLTGARLFNVYGPTETAIFATAWECVVRPTASVLPIGKALSDTRIYVLDAQRQLLPFGLTGEIYIGGDAVALGYLNRRDLTDSVFLADPFNASARMYKTGDRGWMGLDGNLNFVGRNDRQIKLRGYRIELGEIEAVLASVEGVTQAAAKLIEHEGKTQIHAWVAVGGGGHTAEHLQRTLRMRLPNYMVPAGIEVLTHLPESSAGKIDYFNLPSPRHQAQTSIVRPPEGGMESELLALWQGVLQQPTLTVTDNFFDMGGDSLAAISILSGIEKMIGRRVPMYLITERPTVEGLAAALGEGTASTGLMIQLGSEASAPAGEDSTRALVYLAASGHGDLMRFQTLALALDDVCELRMLQPPSASTIARTGDLAALYAKVVIAQGARPCYLAGFSVGGLAALETSNALRKAGVDVKALFLVDTIYPSRLWGGTFLWRLLRRLVVLFHIQDLSMNGRRLGAMLNDPGLFSQVMAVKGYRASRFEGTTHLIKSAGLATKMNGLLFWGWRKKMGNGLHEHQVPGMHGSMFDSVNVDGLSKVIRIAIDGTQFDPTC